MSGPDGQEDRRPASYPGLLAALMAAVRPGFRGDVLGFDPRDPVFGGPPCLVDGCDRPGRHRGLCQWHYSQWLVRKPDFEEFVATADPEWRPRSTPSACQVPGCEYAGQALGFCQAHYSRYLRAGRPDASDWITSGPPPVTPPDPLADCLVPACGLWARPGAVFCHAHASAWRLHGRPDPAGFAAGYGDEAKLGRDRISLRALSPQLRLEWQYAFQARSDAGRQKVNPGEAQRAVNFTAAAGVASLLDWDEDRWRQHKPPPGQPGVTATTPRSLIVYARRQAENLAFGRGWDVEHPRDTWRLRNLGIIDPIANVRFGGIPQPWLKDLAKRWCRWRLSIGLSPGLPARGARVLAHFGTWLAGQDENAGIEAVTRPLLERYLAALHAEFGGRKLQQEHIENLNGFLTAVRQHEWAPGLPASAMIFTEDYPKRGERLPRALAGHVMAQIEDPANLDRWTDPGRRLITLILIRCGLRVGDACKLPSDCIVADGGGQPYLRYYNHKMKREALVPLDEEIVAGIGQQRQRNAARWPGGTPVLFPRPTKNIAGTIPANGDAYRGGLRRWLASCDIRGQDGSTIRLTPHQFRHYVDGRVMWPAAASPLVAEPRVLVPAT